MTFTKDDLAAAGYFDTGLTEIMGEYAGNEQLIRFHLSNFLFDHPIKADLIEHLVSATQDVMAS
jgi:hypothetical protein